MLRLAIKLTIAFGWLSYAFAEDIKQKEVIILPSGVKISKTTSKGMLKPHKTIAVCSDGNFDDVGNLRKVAKYIVPEEHYKIINALDLPNNFDHDETTLIYYGKPIHNTEDANDCLKRFPDLIDIAKRETKSSDEKLENIDKNLRNKFNFPPSFKSNWLCGGGFENVAESKKYSIGVRYAGNACSNYYILDFGLENVCLGDTACSISDTSISKAFAEIEKLP